MYKKSFSLFLLLFVSCCLLHAQAPVLPTRWTKPAMDDAVPFPEYPRPQLQRSDWMCLNGNWDYVGGKTVPDALNPDKPASFRGKPEQIRVPYCAESVLSGIPRKEEINMWYRRNFEIPSDW